MSKHLVALTVTTLLGVAVGGFVLWKGFKRRRSKSSPVTRQRLLQQQQQQVPGGRELPAPGEDQLHSIAPRASWEERILGAKVMTVSQEAEWDQIEPSLRRELEDFPVLGIDCEWVNSEGKASPLSLLQMASPSGFCVLVRLPKLICGGKTLPKTLLDILADGTILKVGVGCSEDASKLLQDYGLVVKGCLDLRYLAMRQRNNLLSNGLSLKSLSETVLNFPLDKSLLLRCSNWDAENLTEDQVIYAARDAQISVALFLHLLGYPFSRNSTLEENDDHIVWRKILEKCQDVVDIPFRSKGLSRSGEEVNGEATESQQKIRNKKSKADGTMPGNHQGRDPRKHKRKPLGVGYSARKSPLYDNCFLHAPDGQPLCTCDRRKAQWYLDKGIGELVSEEPFVVKLQFEPAGRPESPGDYYLMVKENLCVVCGKKDSYIRKNVIPHEYRKHFPIEMKDHNSHDVLLLCTSCHAISNYYDNHLKQQLAREFQAPIGSEEGLRLLEDPERRQVRSGARALLNAESLPAHRKEELLQALREFYRTDTVTEEMLQEAASLETRISNENYVPHGLKVVQRHTQGGLRSLMQLESRWRQHFLDSMQPRHLPQQWSVDHNHQKLLRKYGEDLPIKLS
ncbi:exonuclease 3'-5' domain-containing protein 2 isoform X1 [Cervus elaphus]|uniref:exonuclease 3'-5' domain-containing protein 2 isoform X1 n=2 Tax=Cervus canadensis TaxID=1574408 RepID=UPI0018B9B414|nr:exonuclease 3'-5' domain-containing protein 2 isoform X1 [Cervus canadensis]XP_043328318.1 exonuclease 3'-5' domain-containing protein 2 isoform X1 [Cervus canadensis]XP_043776390.1 exonuclease 3'-5' domain-containing protein 2 isoform X1 [Cervus elaphus]XP_043776391.1 exonuclease 3'-5' domain-containing protein 2 isoform X1 [Cervus elaphus]